MKGTITARWLFVAVAALTFVSQAAVASHIPALDDEPVSKCQDDSKHFCPEVVNNDEGPCVLCLASVGSVAFSFATLSESAAFAEAVPVVDEAGPRSVLKFTPAAPRAPPAG
jgi:hypothetical protein